MTTKIFLIDQARYTPFDKDFIYSDFSYLMENGLEIVQDYRKADLLVGTHYKKIKKFILTHPSCKNYLLWTNEPRFSKTSNPVWHPYIFFWKVRVMNPYTGNVFINNVTYQEKRFSKNSALPYLKKDNFSLTNRKAVALMSFYNGGKNAKWTIGGKNIDLIKTRSDIALFGVNRGFLDVYGKGWPEGVSLEDSRAGDWTGRKKIILKNYNFNLCFENTVFPNYITEKIWDAIENYCLPIYYGGHNSTVYKSFPKDSFIDYNEFRNPESLFKFLEEISEEEFIRRMNICLDVYNSFSRKPSHYWKMNKVKMLDNIIETIKKYKTGSY